METCNATLTTEVVEIAETVTITVTAAHSTTNDCLDRAVVELYEPLGQRRIVDGPTGNTLPLTPLEPQSTG